MALKDSDIDVIDDYIPEYETASDQFLAPIRASNPSGVTYSDIMSTGFEFEVNQEENEESESVNNAPYWTRDEIISHLGDNPRPDEELFGDCATFDERLAAMTAVKDFEDGVYKRVIREGVGDAITADSAVMYHLNAFLEGQDEPFDSTWLRGKPYLHRLNSDTVLAGLWAGLLTMRRGERCELIVRPKYAYLEMGCPPRVPENATVLYIVEVLRIFEEGTLSHFETRPADERQHVEFDKIYQLCDTERISGNSYYKQEKYREAAFRYRRAIRNLEQLTYKNRSDEQLSKQLLLKLYVNIANTYNKIQRPISAMSNCKRALEIDKKCVKALYHYGVAYMVDGRYDESKKMLNEANRLKPDNRGITDALTRLDKRMANDRIKEEELYKRMASGLSFE